MIDKSIIERVVLCSGSDHDVSGPPHTTATGDTKENFEPTEEDEDIYAVMVSVQNIFIT